MKTTGVTQKTAYSKVSRCRAQNARKYGRGCGQEIPGQTRHHWSQIPCKVPCDLLGSRSALRLGTSECLPSWAAADSCCPHSAGACAAQAESASQAPWVRVYLS